MIPFFCLLVLNLEDWTLPKTSMRNFHEMVHANTPAKKSARLYFRSSTDAKHFEAFCPF
jgi:hypothetical protein